ncbi:NrfD/PsrC family molybdoenzyme membrane anchor subunit [Brachybacterium paraconglomeratum]|uniref:NrfD/PsrC family molybdoenzyme membrane anchor subunit n=1 Tax=Brachybacterium paraconglomeratum TaxID=173362 RepID=UPI0022AE5A61|nr:NrfD/PsrC family molybdoenzyme membrane anchor subunit [Brachybacterium paraconglomeratum]MCZ4325558.1 polysulfide reductase NrfD [Brachybacterium paraconglomeratum]
MSITEYDADRPPEKPRRRGGGKRRRRRGLGEVGMGDGSREGAVVEDVEIERSEQYDSYYGRPVVKAPPWKAPIAVYLFLGGVAGGSGLLAFGAQCTGRPVLRRNARLTALGTVGVGTLALIEDLGRPERFLNMMRTVKVTSPMSLGTWVVGGFASLSGVLGALEVDRLAGEKLPLGALRPLLRAAEGPASLGQAALAPVLASYTGALLGNTVVPTWEAGRGHLPYLFASSASLAAGGAAMVTTPVAEAGPARLLAAAGVAGDVASMHLMKETMHPLEREPLETGTPGKLLTWAERLAIAGGVGTLLGGRSRVIAAASGAALLTASALTRFGVLNAGLESVKDPRRVIEPQKARLAARRAAGITDDSITTAG